MATQKRKIRNRIKLGLEIELIYNSELFNFDVGGYHNGIKKGKYWEIQRDTSIYTRNAFEGYGVGAEFVTSILKSKKTFFNAMQEFKDFFKFGNEQIPLNECFQLNNSCGIHLHIGLNNKKKYCNKLRFSDIKKLRELFFKKIKNSDVLTEQQKARVLNHYYRGYAKRTTKEQWYKTRYLERYQEFNKKSENDGLGLEWRSLNALGVNNWAEFEEIIKIIYECAVFLFEYRTQDRKGKFKQIRLNRADLKKKLEQQNKNFEISLKLPITKTELTINNKSDEVLKCAI